MSVAQCLNAYSFPANFSFHQQKNATSSNSTTSATWKRCKNLSSIRKRKVCSHRCHHIAKVYHHRGKFPKIIRCTFKCIGPPNAYSNRLALRPYHFVVRLRWVIFTRKEFWFLSELNAIQIKINGAELWKMNSLSQSCADDKFKRIHLKVVLRSP